MCVRTAAVEVTLCVVFHLCQKIVACWYRRGVGCTFVKSVGKGVVWVVVWELVCVAVWVVARILNVVGTIGMDVVNTGAALLDAITSVVPTLAAARLLACLATQHMSLFFSTVAVLLLLLLILTNTATKRITHDHFVLCMCLLLTLHHVTHVFGKNQNVLT